MEKYCAIILFHLRKQIMKTIQDRILHQKITDKDRKLVKYVVRMVIKEYGGVLKRLKNG